MIRIQPTYEELKPRLAGASSAKYRRIQPTYEELKQKRKRDLVRSIIGASLPMRN